VEEAIEERLVFLAEMDQLGKAQLYKARILIEVQEVIAVHDVCFTVINRQINLRNECLSFNF